MVKPLLFLISVCCALIAGYYSGLQQRLAILRDVPKQLTQSPSEPLQRSLAFALSVVAEEKKRHSSHALPSDISVLNNALDRTTLSAHERALWKVLGEDEAGAKLRRFLIADHHEKEVPGAHLLVSRYMEDLKSNPEMGLRTLQSALDRIPSYGFPAERASLLMSMNEVVEKSDVIKARSLDELIQKSDAPPSEVTEAEGTEGSTAELLLPVVAHQVFLKNTSDSDEALNGTVEGMAAQGDEGVRVAIAAQFLGVYPDLRESFGSALRDKGIETSLPSAKNDSE